MSGRATTGLQPDGSYIPCPSCGYEPPTYDGPGVPVRMPGTTHLRTCEKVAFLTNSEAEARLRADLDAIAECHRRAWRESQGIVIG